VRRSQAATRAIGVSRPTISDRVVMLYRITREKIRANPASRFDRGSSPARFWKFPRESRKRPSRRFASPDDARATDRDAMRRVVSRHRHRTRVRVARRARRCRRALARDDAQARAVRVAPRAGRSRWQCIVARRRRAVETRCFHRAMRTLAPRIEHARRSCRRVLHARECGARCELDTVLGDCDKTAKTTGF
jgi:hypothetical protein